jgi:MOSC domain-containing protein YiiM
MSPEPSPRSTLLAIYLKRAHYGPMDRVGHATLRAGRGLVGNADQGGRRQVTIMSAERWDGVQRELGAPIDPARRRANLLVSTIDLEESRGRVLKIGACRLRIAGETRPCERMEEAAAGLQRVMRERWGGGAYAEVLDDGEIGEGDDVGWEP